MSAPWRAMRELRTGRLALEPQTVAHAARMFDVLSDPAIYEFENAPPRSLEWLRERFAKLETRRSGDGTEAWLNWVVRVSDGGDLAGYVQATVYPTGRAVIAYELGSAFWKRGIGREAVEAMMDELASEWGVHTFTAVLKARNHRSMRLLARMGFVAAEESLRTWAEPEDDEAVMAKETRDVA